VRARSGSIWRKVQDRLHQRRDRKKEPDLNGGFWNSENRRREAFRLRDMSRTKASCVRFLSRMIKDDVRYESSPQTRGISGESHSNVLYGSLFIWSACLVRERRRLPVSIFCPGVSAWKGSILAVSDGTVQLDMNNIVAMGSR
jgi:hypothetical protein